jgi:uncharacterized protein YmfQ (DUF2313 family)
MPLPVTTQDDCTQTLYSLLSTGRLWDYVRTGASRASQMLMGLAVEHSRVNNTIEDLWRQMDPRNALDTDDPTYVSIAMLPRLEALYGLPDPAIGVPATNDERRALLHSRMIATGGQTEAYYIEVALALGVAITIDDPYASGGWTPLATPIHPFYTLSVSHSWLVHAPAVTPAATRTALETMITRYRPAHTAVYFIYDL